MCFYFILLFLFTFDIPDRFTTWDRCSVFSVQRSVCVRVRVRTFFINLLFLVRIPDTKIKIVFSSKMQSNMKCLCMWWHMLLTNTYFIIIITIDLKLMEIPILRAFIVFLSISVKKMLPHRLKWSYVTTIHKKESSRAPKSCYLNVIHNNDHP